MTSEKGGGGLRFFTATVAWLAGLSALAFSYQVIAGLPQPESWSFWAGAELLGGWIGALLPFATFAGGVAAFRTWSPRSVAFQGLLLSIVSYALLAYGLPTAQYHERARVGADLAIEFPLGPSTPGTLRALRSAVEADPPDNYALRFDRPLEHPPNWLTYLIHSLVVFAGFAVLAALLGQHVGFLTSGLSPPARKNARLALGCLSAAGFFLAEAAGGDWVRLDPANSGIIGAWLPVAVPLFELFILEALSRRLRNRAYDSPPLGIPVD